MHTLTRIISGGQTGADQAGLFVAERFGLPTGGWAAAGWRTSRGPAPMLLRDRFRLAEYPGGYAARTRANVEAADGTLRVAFDFTTAGEQCTATAIAALRTPSVDVFLGAPRPVAEVLAWLTRHDIRILNIAGNRERPATAGTFVAACHYLRALFERLRLYPAATRVRSPVIWRYSVSAPLTPLLGRIHFVAQITRAMLRTTPQRLFVFGDNLAQTGLGGQAGAMRGEPNAVGLPTKRRPARTPDAYLTDRDLAMIQQAALPAIQRLTVHLRQGGDVIWPAAGIGTGLADLPRRAPAIATWYAQVLRVLQTIP